jgi:hypothetical protein
MPSSAPITCRCRAMAPAAADGARRRAAGRRTWLRERSPRPRLGSTSPPSNPTEMSMTATPNPAKVSVSWEEFAPGCQGSRLAPPGTWPVEGDGGCNARGIGAGGDRRPRARHKAYRTVCVIGYGPDDYNPQQANETTVIKPPPVVGDGGGWLVVDDLIDTGRTAKVLRKLMPIAHFAHLREAPRPGAGQYLRHRGEPGHLDLFPLGKRSDGVDDHAAHRRLNTAIPAIVRLHLCRRHFPRNLSLEETRTDRLIV